MVWGPVDALILALVRPLVDFLPTEIDNTFVLFSAIKFKVNFLAAIENKFFLKKRERLSKYEGKK